MSPLRRFIPLALAGTLAISACGTATPPGGLILSAPGMVADAREQYYEVQGSTADDLRRSLRENGPDVLGRRVFGRHEGNLRWTGRWSSASGECRMTEVRVELRSIILLPRWRPPPEAPDSLVAEWDRFIAALTAHEYEHRRLWADGARTARSDLSRLRTSSCSTMQIEASRTVERILSRVRQANQRLDERTRGGMTEGAVWPPRRPPRDSDPEEPSALERETVPFSPAHLDADDSPHGGAGRRLQPGSPQPLG
jgi:predicted secreted Zn-dependent protease